jgi:hypothetical protein
MIYHLLKLNRSQLIQLLKQAICEGSGRSPLRSHDPGAVTLFLSFLLTSLVFLNMSSSEKELNDELRFFIRLLGVFCLIAALLTILLITGKFLNYLSK